MLIAIIILICIIIILLGVIVYLYMQVYEKKVKQEVIRQREEKSASYGTSSGLNRNIEIAKYQFDESPPNAKDKKKK